MHNFRKILSISAILSVSLQSGLGATITAAGVSQSAVQSAVNAAAPGDTVLVPAGSATWDTEVGIVNKSLTIRGAGIGNTVITRNTAVGAAALHALMKRTNFVTISGFTFSTVTSAQYGIVSMEGEPAYPVCQFRITGCRFNVAPSSPSVGFRGIGVAGTYGLIDHCWINNSSGNGQGVSFLPDSALSSTNTYHTPQAYGDTNTVVVEDCVFDFANVGDGAVDAYVGSKFVFRYNLVTNTVIAWHGADSSVRSIRLFEIYGNTLRTANGVSPFTTIRARGGTGVVFSNNISGAWGDFFVLSHYGADPAYSRETWGPMTGVNPADGNFDASGYPGLDQVGRGSFPAGNPGQWPTRTSYTPSQYEALEPLYQWGNSYKGNTSPLCVVANPAQSTNLIKPNRDYYDNTPKPGYRPLVYPHPLAGGTVSSLALSDIPDQLTSVNTPVAPVPFQVAGPTAGAANLTLSKSSSNEGLVPTNNIVFGGSGTNRTVALSPAANQTGTATIVVTASDGTNIASDSFLLRVVASNTAPTISSIPNQTINEDTSTGSIGFTVGDAETSSASLTVSGSSSNPGLVPAANIVFGGSGANRTVTASPAAHQSGTSTITVTVSDGQYSTSSAFVLTVNPVNDTPTISSIPPQAISVGGTAGPLPFTVGDVETAAGSLIVSASSSNPVLVPNANIALGGSGSNRTISVSAVSGQTGIATITVQVSDGQLSGSTSFTVNAGTGAIYYVDNSGNPPSSDSPDYGSESKPWRTITYAMGRISGGDTVLVKNGTYNEPGLYIYGPSGSPGAETVLKAYPGHFPLFRGMGNTGRMAVDGVGYMRIEGLDIANLNQCIQVRNGSHHITIRGCNVHDCGNELIRAMSNSHDVLFEGNMVHDGGSIGDHVNGEGFYIGTSTPADNTYNVTIRSNVIYNTLSEGIELKPGSHDCLVEGNIIYTNNMGTVPASSIEIDEVNSYASNPNHVVRNNVVHDSGPLSHGIRAGTGCTVYNNIVYNINSARFAIMVDNGSGDTYTRRIYHNTLDVPSNQALSLGGGATDIRNNIGPSIANNLPTNPAYYVNASLHNYRLVAGSAPIDAGADLSSFVPTDCNGRPRPYGAAPDMGACEYAPNPFFAHPMDNLRKQ